MLTRQLTFALAEQLWTSLVFGTLSDPAIVLDVTGRNRIEASDLMNTAIRSNHHVLIKTDNSSHLREPQFRPEHCYLAADAATYILSCDPLSIGFDYYSFDPPSANAFPAHTRVAKRGLPAFVCLDLSAVYAGSYDFFAIPLSVIGAEGMPVRAVLMERSSE